MYLQTVRGQCAVNNESYEVYMYNYSCWCRCRYSVQCLVCSVLFALYSVLPVTGENLAVQTRLVIIKIYSSKNSSKPIGLVYFFYDGLMLYVFENKKFTTTI